MRRISSCEGSLSRTYDKLTTDLVEVAHVEKPEPETDIGISNQKSLKETRS